MRYNEILSSYLPSKSTITSVKAIKKSQPHNPTTIVYNSYPVVYRIAIGLHRMLGTSFDVSLTYRNHNNTSL